MNSLSKVELINRASRNHYLASARARRSIEPDSIYRVVTGSRAVKTSVAFRVARLAEASIDDLLSGRFLPAGTCPHCSHPPDDAKP
jgi:hypothetical protein